MGCIRRIITLLLLLAVVVIAFIVFFPRFLAQAGNTLINNTNSSFPSLSGVAEIIPANFNNKANQLQISLSGLIAHNKYDVTLDPGQCGSSNYVNVGIITTDASGTSNATFNVSSLDTSKIWYVDVHNATDASGSVVACGQLNMNSSSVAADATASTSLPLSNSNAAVTTGTGATATPSPPQGFPNTGVAPGGSNSYDNNVYPRKF